MNAAKIERASIFDKLQLFERELGACPAAASGDVYRRWLNQVNVVRKQRNLLVYGRLS